MMRYTDHCSPLSRQHRVTRLTASILLLSIATLGIIFVFLVLRVGSVVSASQKEDTLNWVYHTPDSAAAAGATSAVDIIRAVEMPRPDARGVVTICSSIGGLDPRSLDIVLALDVSGSMNDSVVQGSTQTRLEASQAAAIAFVSLLSNKDRVGVVPFSDTARLAQPLTTSKDAVIQTIWSLTATGNTNIGGGIDTGHQELTASSPYMSDTIKAIILLSDGQANRPVDVVSGTEYARRQAEAAASDNIRIYTIGFGSEADQGLLQGIANISGGRYFSATDSNALNTIYQALGTRVGCHYLPIIFNNWTPPGIVNGGFENGWTGWITGGNLAKTITTFNPHSGNFSALLGDPTYVCQNGVPVGSAAISQTVIVPDTISPTLTFWYHILTQDKNSYLDDQFDSFDVMIEGVLRFRKANTDGPYGCAPQDRNDLGWQLGQLDLHSYRGQRITIRLVNRNSPDAWYNTWTYVDDVQIAP